MNPVIEIEKLTKQYGRHRALDQLSMTVPQGSIFGFLGPNGAGKTTALRILVGLLRRTKGAARVLGLDAWKNSTEICSRVGYLPGDVRFPQHMKGGAFLAMGNELRGGRSDLEIERLRERLDLDLKRRIRNYSRGMKQKLGLIYAMMHRPELLILDEPTTALDPLVQQLLYAELRAVVADGRTVLFSSHTLGEVEELCNSVAIIRAGKLIESSTIDQLKARALRRVEFRLKPGKSIDGQTPPPGMGGLAWRESRATATWRGDAEQLVSWLSRIGVADVTIGAPDLEDLFSDYYRANDAVALDSAAMESFRS
ncbi:MAG TPA: ABC transporter ATP-binding protein [Phycisphaerae bacterium]|nr:ABC transporter ATP-binding protein [Phycisphaerae bacterium]